MNRQKTNSADSLTQEIKGQEKRDYVISPVSFGDRKSIGNTQMRALGGVNQGFCRSLGMQLSSKLKTQVRSTLISAERQAYMELLNKLDSEDIYIALLRVHPLESPAILCLGASLISPIIDLMLGGSGSEDLRSRELSDIDVLLLTDIFDVVCAELTLSWRDAAMSAKHQQRLFRGSLGQVLPARDNVLVLSYELQVGGASGLLRIICAAGVANQLLRAISEPEEKRVPSDQIRQQIANRLQHVSYRTSLQMPVGAINMTRLRTLEPGDILGFQRAAAEPAMLLVAGRPLLEAIPASDDGRKAALVRSHVAKINS